MKRNGFGFDGFTSKGYKYRKTEGIRVFFDSIPADLSENAILLLLMLARVANNENMLVEKVPYKSRFSSIRYSALTIEEMRTRTAKVYGIVKYKKAFTELKKHCLKKIKYNGINAWAINPAFVMCSPFLPIWLYNEFQEDINPHLTAYAIKTFRSKINEWED